MTRSAKHKPAKSLPAKAASPTSTAARACAADDAISQQHDAPLLVLHVVRILALYLYVLLARQPHHDAISLNELFFPETKTMERLVESTATSIEQQVHAALLACVQGEIASNQFDGLIQEKTVFAALQRIFRQQKVHVKSQCRLLVRLLNSYLAQLTHAPIVRCESMGMLASTLEYLAHGGVTQAKKEPVAASLLYPLVNAIDSLSIEQRECLDALTTLWQWLETCELSKTLLDRIVRLHHNVIFYLEPTNAANAKATAANHGDDLGACFVRTLVRHADHIFRHDLDFTNPHDLLTSESEVEDDASSSSRLLPPAPSTPPPKKTAQAPSISPSKLKTKTKPLAQPELKASVKATEEPILIDAHEPMPANMMRVGIAAAAGTLAAALCVIFT